MVVKWPISVCNRMRPSRIKDKFSRVFSRFSQNCPSRAGTRAICETMKIQVKFILNSTRTQCDYLFITQRAKFSENFPRTLKHNQPARRINVPVRKQFTIKEFNCCSTHRTRTTGYYVHLKR